MGPGQDVDAVDLVKAEPVDRASAIAAADRLRARAAKALGRKSDPPGLGEREFFDFRHLVSQRGRWGARS